VRYFLIVGENMNYLLCTKVNPAVESPNQQREETQQIFQHTKQYIACLD
jgi:hypothetical protein